MITNKVILDKQILSEAPELKLICVTATGLNNIDLKEAERRNILVKNARNYSTDSVAQTTFAMVLQLLMQLERHHYFVENQYIDHRFFTHLNPDFTELNGKTWGIIGLGNIGRKVAEIATSFGCEVIYHSPSGNFQQVAYKHTTLETLLESSDVISVHTPLNDYTKNLLTYNKLKHCKKTALLINTARGGIINETDLVKVLDESLIAGAATDVFSAEPITPANPLLNIKDHSKLLLTPHIAWGSKEARKKLMEITKENILDYLNASKS